MSRHDSATIRTHALQVHDGLLRVHHQIREFDERKLALSNGELTARAHVLAQNHGAGTRAALLALLESTELIHARLDALESGTDD